MVITISLISGNSLAVQWLGLNALVMGPDLILDWETKIPYVVW